MTWISIKDRLPYVPDITDIYKDESSEEVLVTDGKSIDIANRFKHSCTKEENWTMVENSWGFTRVEENEISHWMPLPELPKENE